MDPSLVGFLSDTQDRENPLWLEMEKVVSFFPVGEIHAIQITVGS